MKNNSSVFFSSNLIYFGQKKTMEEKFSDFWVVGWKFTKFLMLYLKQQISFSLNFVSLFSAMRDSSSALFFSLNFIWFGQRSPSKCKISDFQLLTLYNRVVLLKLYKIPAKKVPRNYVSWHGRVKQSLKKTWLVVSKMTRGILQIFTRALKSLKIGTLMGFVYPK